MISPRGGGIGRGGRSGESVEEDTMADEFLYKRVINKSVLYDGFGIDREYLDIFLRKIQPLKRGDKQDITFLLGGKEYAVELKNLNNPRDRRKNDAYQIRYTPDGEFAKALQAIFFRTYQFVQNERSIKQTDSKRQFTKIPDDMKEYLAIYTTSDPSVFACEPIVLDDLRELKRIASNQNERLFEATFNYDVQDDFAGINRVQSVVSVRKLNRKIGDALKEHYRYRCQICGCCVGTKYDSHLVEAHHINYFVKSLDNNMSNILIVCPNHHGIIHDKNPVFHRADCTFEYPNGYVEGLKLNDHLHG